eukprot:403373318
MGKIFESQQIQKVKSLQEQVLDLQQLIVQHYLLLYSENIPEIKLKVQKFADFMERHIHTNPSGVDVAISLNGGFLKFLRGPTPSQNVLQFLEIDQQVKEQIQMILVNTNKPRNSKTTIEAVMNLKNDDFERFTQIMNQIGNITYQITQIYMGQESNNQSTQENTQKLMLLINQNQILLQDLGVSCDEIQQILKHMEEFNYCGKLTGAGGGGCVIGFCKQSDFNSEKLVKLQEKLEESGFSLSSNIENSNQGFNFQFI